MLRQVKLSEISDGRLYGGDDMVKADCHGCEGCSACCRGMGSSILLDPLDVFQLTSHLGRTFEGLLEDAVELNVADGIILPNLKMASPDGACAFLDREGRCLVHPFRPGICRLFPLGRYYEDGSFRYFLQTGECKMGGRTKIKVRKWVDVPEWKEYEAFVADWHYFLRRLQDASLGAGDTRLAKESSMYVLERFYLRPYREDEPFYGQYRERRDEAKRAFP